MQHPPCGTNFHRLLNRFDELPFRHNRIVPAGALFLLEVDGDVPAFCLKLVP